MTSAALQMAPLVLHSAVTFPVAFSNCSRHWRLLCIPLFFHPRCDFLWIPPFLFSSGNIDLCNQTETQSWCVTLAVNAWCHHPANLSMNELQPTFSFMRITPSLGGWYSDLLHFKDWLNYWFLADLAVWSLLWCINCSSSISMLMNTTGKREGRGQQFCFQQKLMFRRELCD